MTWQITVQEINCPFFYPKLENNNCGHLDNGEKSCIEINCPLKVISHPSLEDKGDINNMIDLDIVNTFDVDTMSDYFRSDKAQRKIIKRIQGYKE